MSTATSRRDVSHKYKRWKVCLPGCHLILSAPQLVTSCTHTHTRTHTHTHTHAHSSLVSNSSFTTHSSEELSLHEHSHLWYRLWYQIEPCCHAGVIRASSSNLPPLSFLHTSSQEYGACSITQLPVKAPRRPPPHSLGGLVITMAWRARGPCSMAAFISRFVNVTVARARPDRCPQRPRPGSHPSCCPVAGSRRNKRGLVVHRQIC